MNNKWLAILGVITVLMIIWAVVQSHITNKPRAKLNANSYLIQGLDPDDIGSIVIGNNEKSVTLKRNESSFVVVNKDDYPAISKEINSIITSCLDIRTTELYTANPDNFTDLGVNEDNAEAVVRFLKNDSSLLAGIIIGKKKEQGNGTFVRMISSNNVYVTLEAPYINNDANSYVDQELFSLNREDVELVKVKLSDKTYTLKKDKESNTIVFEDLPEGKKLNMSNAESVYYAITNLRFVDVKKHQSIDNGLTFDKQFLCKMKDSTLYSLKIAQKDDDTFITCESEFTDKTPVVKEDGVESEEELKKKEAKLLANEKAAEFQAKHNGWVYKISNYSARNLTKDLTELLDDVEKEKKDEEKAEEIN